MNWPGKIFLVMTSLAPILGVCGINSVMHERWTEAAWFFGIFGVLVAIFAFLFKVARWWLPQQTMKTDKVRTSDKEVLAFLLSYLLPFFGRESSQFVGEVGSAVVVVLVIGYIVFHSTAYTFNPMLAFLGYHFFEVESGGMTYLLITKQMFVQPQNTLVVRHLCDYIYIDDHPHAPTP